MAEGIRTRRHHLAVARRKVAPWRTVTRAIRGRQRTGATSSNAPAAANDVPTSRLPAFVGSEEVLELTLGLVAHDLRSPLQSSRRVLDDLCRSSNGHGGMLYALSETLAQVERTVTDLLRVDSLECSARRERVALDELVRECVARCSGPNRTTVAALPIQTDADSSLLRAAVGNVIENALDHARTQVLVRVGPHAEGSLVIVDDDGPGIPAPLREVVFCPLVQLDPERRQGPGLGLALARRVAALHHGEIWADDAPSGGARFCLWLPPS
jgi:signal transduction histidine kinase